jgi:hypothetical protein
LLLKDHEREDARKARAETKRKAHVAGMRGTSFGPDGSGSGPSHHSGVFETPSRRRRNAETESPGSDVPSVPDGDAPGEDMLMGDAEREELLGKKGAEAVGKILWVDREKRGKGEKKEERGIMFWDVNAEVPFLFALYPLLLD